MVKTFKKPLSLLLMAVMMLGLFVAAPTQAGASSTIWSTTSGSTQVDIYSDSLLVVSGYGAMANYTLNASGETTAPWFFVTQFGLTPKIAFADGVTHVGNYAFYLPPSSNYNIHMINLSDTIKTIGEHAFANIKKLKMISIPASVTSIGEHAFEGCNNIETIKCFAEPSEDLHLDNIVLGE